MYLSTFDIKSLAKMDRDVALSRLGIFVEGEGFIVPPTCNLCSGLVVDMVNDGETFDGLSLDMPWQCTECGALCRIYLYEDTCFLRGLL